MKQLRIYKFIILRMQSSKSTENPEKQQISSGKKHTQDTMPENHQQKLKVQMLRMKASIRLKQIPELWQLSEQQLKQYLTHYETMPCSQITVQMIEEKEKVRVIKTENKIYFGEIENKKKEGIGISIYRDGKFYEGQFHLNEKAGFGTEVYGNGNLYVGEFGQNKKHGQGTFYWYNISTSPQGCVEQYHGGWWGGLPDGDGKHLKVNGDFYVGKFKNGLKHGEGKEDYANGDIYRGSFVNGLPEGYGEYFWCDQSTYKGDFKQGSRNGYGVWKDPKVTGQNYKGHYMIDKKHGFGIYDWGNGYVYKGYFMEDLRFGEGELYANGQLQYKGYWQNGQKVKDKPKLPVVKQLKETSQTEPVRSVSQSKTTYKLPPTKEKFDRERKYSADKRRPKNQEKHELSRLSSRPRENTEQGASRSKCGHKNCIPTLTIGKMPRPSWKNAWKK